jgi:hypothetical protein
VSDIETGVSSRRSARLELLVAVPPTASTRFVLSAFVVATGRPAFTFVLCTTEVVTVCLIASATSSAAITSIATVAAVITSISISESAVVAAALFASFYRRLLCRKCSRQCVYGIVYEER